MFQLPTEQKTSYQEQGMHILRGLSMGKNVRNFEIIIWDIERKKALRVLSF